MTHLHIDHTSAISEFPNSTFVVSETEWQAATHGSSPMLEGYRRSHFDYAFDYRTVDFHRGDVDSYASFGRTFDLFGDGSLRLAYTPGHSAGHMSVICRLEKRDFVIGGDCFYVMGQLDGSEPAPPRPQDSHNLRRSLQELRLFRSQFPDAVITPSHDPDFYAAIAALRVATPQGPALGRSLGLAPLHAASVQLCECVLLAPRICRHISQQTGDLRRKGAFSSGFLDCLGTRGYS
jgi:glyoxylase-like metal-dependent hydrolase (beta-lactamase superfamily II)